MNDDRRAASAPRDRRGSGISTGQGRVKVGIPRRKGRARARLGLVTGFAAVAAVVAVTATTATASSRSVSLKASESGITLKSSYTAAKAPTSQIAKTDPKLLGRTSSKPIPVMIKYNFDATASYKGGVRGLKATSPRVTGLTLKQNAKAVSAYTRYAKSRISTIDAAMKRAVPSIAIRQSYQTVYGGIAAMVPANKVGQLLKVPGVVAVQQDALEQPLDDNTAFLGAQTVWQNMGGAPNAGKNVVLGVLDTGVWPEQPMLSPNGVSAPPGGLRGCQFGDGSDPALGPAFAC